MKAIHRRLQRLEERFGATTGPREHWRIVVCAIGSAASLKRSTCRRTIDGTGLLTGIVGLVGTRDCFTDAELEEFVAGFPIHRVEGGERP